MRVKLNNVKKVLKKREVIKTTNLEFESGKIYGIHGINGSGKTVLLKLICGLSLPTSGEVVVDGAVLGQDIDFVNDLGVCFADVSMNSALTGFDNLKELAKINKKINDQQIEKVLTQVVLDPHNPIKVKEYSLGMKQRLNFAQAIMESPKLLICDEPTNGLDEDGVEMVRKSLNELRNNGSLILLTSHNKADIDLLSDYKLHIKEGYIDYD